MPKRPAGPRRHDLFELFPDLPWPRIGHGEMDPGRMRQVFAETRARAERNIERQREASARIRRLVAERQAEMLTRHRLTRRRP